MCISIFINFCCSTIILPQWKRSQRGRFCFVNFVNTDEWICIISYCQFGGLGKGVAVIRGFAFRTSTSNLTLLVGPGTCFITGLWSRAILSVSSILCTSNVSCSIRWSTPNILLSSRVGSLECWYRITHTKSNAPIKRQCVRNFISEKKRYT